MPDSQTLLLFIAAMVAAAVCVRLYMILGRRTGAEPQIRTPSPLAPAPRQEVLPPIPSSGGLMDIQLADRSFEVPHFLEGARTAYQQIVTAFAAGDRETLRPLLSPDVMAAFEAGIAARTAPAPAFTRLADARIVGSSLAGRHAEITVSFNAEFGEQTVTDVWTFARDLDAADPNWTLVATSGEVPE